MKRLRHRVMLVLVGGTVLFFGSCLNSGVAKQALLSTALYLGQEYVFDGGIFNLFPSQPNSAG